jgi:hypothetical protein
MGAEFAQTLSILDKKLIEQLAAVGVGQRFEDFVGIHIGYYAAKWLHMSNSASMETM